jgi:hypothetical protein
MLTTREIGPEGFGAKNRDWNVKDLLVDWRSSWADHVNHTLERCNVHERVDHRTLEAQREEAPQRAYVAERNGDERVHVAEMARAVELDRPPLPDVGARGWSMMRRGIATPASKRWQEAREIGLQVHEVAREFQTRAREPWTECRSARRRLALPAPRRRRWSGCRPRGRDAVRTGVQRSSATSRAPARI